MKPKFKQASKVEFKNKYTSIKKVKSSAVKSDIFFNAKGFNHIYYKGNRSERSKKDINTRQRLFENAVKLIKTANILTGKHTVIRLNKDIHYYEIIGLINNRRIKVILRRMGKGQIHFWSVIPAWQYCKDKSLFNMSGRVLE